MENITSYVTGYKMTDILGLKGKNAREIAERYGIQYINVDGVNLFNREDILKAKAIRQKNDSSDLSKKIADAVMKILEEAGLVKERMTRKGCGKGRRYKDLTSLYTVYRHSGIKDSMAWTDFRKAVINLGVETTTILKNCYIARKDEEAVISLMKEHSTTEKKLF